MNNSDQTTLLKLSIQRALLEEVTDRLVAVTARIEANKIMIRMYVRGACNDADLERAQHIATEVIADFPQGFTIEESCVSIEDDDPAMLDFWAFKRARN
jgi:hypothetical protein